MYQHTPKELSERLNDNIHNVLTRLLPGGKKRNHEWQVGSTRGEEGKSLSICLEGSKKGVWCDFATGDSGDLIDLWAAVRSISLKEAILEVKGYLGIADDRIDPPRQNKYVRPRLNPGLTFSDPEYLIAERLLTPETIAKYKVSQTDGTIIFPYFRENEIVMIKYLIPKQPDGKRKIWASKETEPCLFGWQASSGRSRKLCLAEGEIDAMTLYQYGVGMDCMSVPFGAGKDGKQQWIAGEFDNLAAYDEIYLCLDDDDEGHIATKYIMERLGSYRCRIVTLPRKDANDCLKQGIHETVIKRCFEEAVSIDPAELKAAKSYAEQIKKGINHVSDAEMGYALPWTKAFGTINFRPGEMTVWTGINGHGKSQLLGHLMLDQIKQGANVCIASFELRPDKTLIRMMRQASGMKQPRDEYIQQVCDWWGNQLWVFDLVGTAKADRVIEVFKYARQRYGVDVFVIDSLMKCGFSDDDYAGQKRFLDQISDFKNQFNCHIHVVAHPRKAQDENTPPSKLDVKGVSGITDLADNCISVWRNKPKEDLINLEKGRGIPSAEDVLSRHDCLFKCSKQRFGDWEGGIGLWFDKDSLQYLERYQQRPVPFV